MTDEDATLWVASVDPGAVRNDDGWSMLVRDLRVQLYWNEPLDRVRLMCEVPDAAPVDRLDMVRMLEANYGPTEDARWALHDGAVYAVFLHPFAALTEHGFFSGLAAAVSMAQAFGETYAAGPMSFADR